MAAALLWSGCEWITPATAGGIALKTPGGLNPGQSFRFVFVTDRATTATSGKLGDYDSFVQEEADGAMYNNAVVKWLAIGSSATEDAIDHIVPTDTPVYLVDGTMVTTSTKDNGLWSGKLKHEIDEFIDGHTPTTAPIGVWTGTDSEGKHGRGGTLGLKFVQNGLLTSTTESWVEADATRSTTKFRVYGISVPETVPRPDPEPSTMLLMVTGGVMVVAYDWTRRHRDRRQRPVVGPPDTPQ
jgi:hypothetical protein